MNPAEFQPHELMRVIVEFLETHNVSYRIVGSLASMAYGEPRFTNDVDVLDELSMDKAEILCNAFPPPDYYVSDVAVKEAIASRRQFNILHFPSGLKIDVILPADSDFSRSELSRGKRLTSAGEFSAWFGSPEDVILKKLLYYQIGGSEKHLRDIAGVLKLQGQNIDRDYIEDWGAKLGVLAEWQLVCDRLQDKGD